MPRDANPAETGHNISARIGYEFVRTELLMRALTHASAAGGATENYERLEFLGDRVLGLAIAQLLFHEFPDADEGELSRRFNLLVNTETCADVADEIGLGEFIVTGLEIKSIKGRKRQNLRADAVEALIAAIYLDGGFDPACTFINRHWQARAHTSDADRRDAKTELQEWAHRRGGPVPVYTIESQAGPDHDPVFTVMAAVAGYEPARGSGRSKREAEQLAAAEILVREGVWQSGSGGQ